MTAPSDTVISPSAYRSFRADTWTVDWATGRLQLGYRLDAGGSDALTFIETVTLPQPAASPNPDVLRAAESLIPLLHAVAGVSYYKVAAPSGIRFGGIFTDAEYAFLRAVYRSGLREFAYANDRADVLDVQISAEIDASNHVDATTSPRRGVLVPCGGGKDSIVTATSLLGHGADVTGFAVNPNRIIEDVIATQGTAALFANRRLDPALFDLNKRGALNGHVPVTAINSLIAVICAIVHEREYVVMSNEASASIPNLTWRGAAVNHQWSKSLEAETLLQSALASRLSGARPYFSYLRPLNELQIARLFARSEKFDSVVTSCNNAFKLVERRSQRWCLNCPKCRFVFLSLASFMPKHRLVEIFGGDMLADPAQIAGYQALLGVGADKPFECVGSVEESLAVVANLAEQPEWRDAPVVRALAEKLAGVSHPGLDEVMTEFGESAMPDNFLAYLRADF